MKRPTDLVQLIEELKDEVHDSTVRADKTAKAVIHIDEDDETGLAFTAEECSLLLHSEYTVKQMHEALGEPEEATISLYNLDLDQEVLDALERTFAAVDEM
jgi:hypothetical protein